MPQTNKVVWEVEVEEERVEMLKGAYVGFLNEDKQAHTLQNFFVMEGYVNLKVITLGHRKVLLTSSKEKEIEKVVGSTGWWCQWIDRFVPWSPASVSNKRDVWLRCYGVPLFAWGISLFKTLAYKFGTFLDVDDATKQLKRGDLARVKVLTSASKIIDSVIEVVVLGQKFSIHVIEENGYAKEPELVVEKVVDEVASMASNDDASFLAVVENGSVDGDDNDMSETCQVLLEIEQRQGRKGECMSTRKKECQEANDAGLNPNFLGKTWENGEIGVNDGTGDLVVSSVEIRQVEVESAGVAVLPGTLCSDTLVSGLSPNAQAMCEMVTDGERGAGYLENGLVTTQVGGTHEVFARL
jgi:hypothetical protein